MKIIKLFLLLTLLCACASAPVYKSGAAAPVRNYPVYLQQGRASVAFKLELKAPGRQINAVLVAAKTGKDAFKIKVLADFATVVIDADFIDNSVIYNNVLGNMFDKKALDIFEDVVRVLFVPPADFIRAGYDEGETQLYFRTKNFMNRYHFRKGLSFPYKMDQIKGTVRKKFMFNNYDIYDNLSLPAEIICKDSKGIVEIKLILISIK